ncbi:putative glycosyltransferase EpsE [Variibacter gotjawalensis]|uniref:Putative glycosyltransferase EpsE n=1 Tax=Variibacter gotjawalensis TaxID=1333996 RepID=A0A0S3PNQ5_9BRAD|nr:glycosyltransferase family 2 protein [Variibacter gotjawalensis]NIK47847.1 glycosyltransferase involved in cell wall biosynthesis [Variibacter gotjawalensis]RZS49734.1 glycosyl transferase family 2 [Variibacter gotjawalensis]BAT57562.1 putative glycosyltransferase EpsE [Variibacter gotjawalensis]
MIAHDTSRTVVLMGVYNGEQFLQEQIESIDRQTFKNIDLLVSDDGSTDQSIALLSAQKSRWNKGSFHIVNGPKQGFAENYRYLITSVALDRDYFAFADQDDIWDEDKLDVACSWLGQQGDQPALFCSRTRTMSVNGKTLGYSPLFAKPPSFRNAIVQSLAGGNTMVMNRAAMKLVAESAKRSKFISHDWWSYLVVTGVGGTVKYDPTPRIGYRQHGGNVVGENDSWRARFLRVRHLFAGRFSCWNDQNISGLKESREVLTPEAQSVICQFERARNASLVKRVTTLHHAGFYRQTLFGNLGLYLACIFRRL